MPQLERKLLLEMHETLKRLNTPPPSTFSPLTGEVNKKEENPPNTYGNTPLTFPKPKG